MYTYSEEHYQYLKKIHKRKKKIVFWRVFIIVSFLFIWELFSSFQLINPFLFSSPSRIIHTSILLLENGDLMKHIGITLYEIFFSFGIGSILGLIISIILWWNDLFQQILDPYITVFNSLPKVALGPLIIIWIGASIHSIITMALMISLFVTILTYYQGFKSVSDYYIIMLKSFGANKWQIFQKIVFPSSFNHIISALKINISMSLIGVIMGELLVSKRGLGYLIMYGSQVFQLDLVITSVFLLGIISYLMYCSINIIDYIFMKRYKEKN